MEGKDKATGLLRKPAHTWLATSQTPTEARACAPLSPTATLQKDNTCDPALFIRHRGCGAPLHSPCLRREWNPSLAFEGEQEMFQWVKQNPQKNRQDMTPSQIPSPTANAARPPPGTFHVHAQPLGLSPEQNLKEF